MTIRISWSSLRVHEECKQKGFLQRAGKRAPMANQRVFFPGTVTDRVVRDWLLADPDKNLGTMTEMVESIMEREEKLVFEGGGRIFFQDKADREAVLRDCIEAVRKIEPSLVKHVLPYDFDVDFRFKAPVNVPNLRGEMEEIILIGAMDIIVRDDDGWFHVWDVKHTKDDYYWKKTMGQLTFYDLTTQIMFGAPTKSVGLLQPLCKEKEKPFTLNVDDRSQMMQRVMGMANDIMKVDKTPQPSKENCMFCDVKHACTLFQPVISNGKRRMSLLS